MFDLGIRAIIPGRDLSVTIFKCGCQIRHWQKPRFNTLWLLPMCPRGHDMLSDLRLRAAPDPWPHGWPMRERHA